MTKIIGIANSCKDCPNRHYFSGGAYECWKVKGRTLNADSSIPEWCPLTDYPSASIADTAGAKSIYQCMANDDDDNPTSRNLWMDVDEKAFDQISIRSDVRARVVYAAPPAPSVADGRPPSELTERERFIWSLGYSSGKENA